MYSLAAFVTYYNKVDDDLPCQLINDVKDQRFLFDFSKKFFLNLVSFEPLNVDWNALTLWETTIPLSSMKLTMPF
jgi:hypothetical protein